MPLTESQQAAVERLRQNEGLTDNLTDGPAGALLAWAQEQIIAGTDPDLVSAAVMRVNREGADSGAQAIAKARESLAALRGRSQPSFGATPTSPQTSIAPDENQSPGPADVSLDSPFSPPSQTDS